MKKITLLFLLFISIPNYSFANETEEVKLFINDFGNKIINIASDDKLKINQKREKLIFLIEGVVDSDWISKFVLGTNYRSATKDQREKFKVLYRQFLINSYSPKFSGYNGESFSISNVENNGNYYTVKCIISRNKDPNVNFDFRIRKNTNVNNKSKFLIFDVVVEGVSLIETQRSEFGSAINKKDNFDSFLVDLEERVKSLKSETSTIANKKIDKANKSQNKAPIKNIN